MPRIIVAIELVPGARKQAACRTVGCAAGRDGGPWMGAEHVVKATAEDEARRHRQWQWHRAQRPVPVEPIGQVPDA